VSYSQLPIGAQAPDFTLTGLDGRSHRLTEALGRGPVVLAFYKGHCPTCQFTFPYIQKIVGGAGKDKSWTIWGISQDDATETRSFAERYGITFDLLIDDYPYAVSSAYGLEFVPAIFIVQPGQTITLSNFGFTKNSLNQIAGFDFFQPNDGLPAARPG
jgi:peroxiredoxin